MTLREKCPYSDSVRMRENTEQKNSNTDTFAVSVVRLTDVQLLISFISED